MKGEKECNIIIEKPLFAFVWMVDWLTDWLTDWLIDWLIDWLAMQGDRLVQSNQSKLFDFFPFPDSYKIENNSRIFVCIGEIIISSRLKCLTSPLPMLNMQSCAMGYISDTLWRHRNPFYQMLSPKEWKDLGTSLTDRLQPVPWLPQTSVFLYVIVQISVFVLTPLTSVAPLT